MGIQINGQTDTISASDGSLSTNDIAINNLTGVAATFTGVLTYEDVTNIDSIGIITAQSGINVTGGGITVTGVSTFTGDLKIADKIRHLNDANTNIGFPAADTFTVETAASERLRITPSGFVGVNTDSPGRQLTVSGGASEGAIQITNNTSGGSAANGFELIHFTSGETQLLNRENGAMRFDTNGTERLRITSGGAAIFKAGTAEKFQSGTTLSAASGAVALSSGNVALFTSNESGNQTVNFTGVHATLSSGENVSFTVIITPNGSGVINALQIDSVAQTIQWSGGSAPSAGASGKDIYTFTLFKTGSGTTDYQVFGAATNYA